MDPYWIRIKWIRIQNTTNASFVWLAVIYSRNKSRGGFWGFL